MYSIESNKWSVINTLETPPPISAHSATIHGNVMVVFGGVSGNGYRYNFFIKMQILNIDIITVFVNLILILDLVIALMMYGV